MRQVPVLMGASGAMFPMVATATQSTAFRTRAASSFPTSRGFPPQALTQLAQEEIWFNRRGNWLPDVALLVTGYNLYMRPTSSSTRLIAAECASQAATIAVQPRYWNNMLIDQPRESANKV